MERKGFSLKLDRAAVIDEYGRLDSEIAALRPKLKRLEQLKEKIQGWYEKEDPSREFREEGEAYTVEVGPRSLERKVRSMKDLKNRLGLVKFLQFARFPLAVLDEILPASEQSSLVTSERTGTRRVTAVSKFTGGSRVLTVTDDREEVPI